MNQRNVLVAVIVAGFFLPCHAASGVHKDEIVTIGIGVVDPKLTNETQERATARDAALVDAQYQMLAILKGLHPGGGSADDKTLQSGILKGAEVVKTEWLEDGRCRVTLRLNKKRFEKLTATAWSDPR